MQQKGWRIPIMLSIVLSVFILLICLIYSAPSAPSETRTHKVAYIPLDNRPVNQERMQYLARSADIELIIPEETLYRTALDNMPPNPDGSTIGNREALRAWLLAADQDCDHFIISLDQMTSGGLVGSRWLHNEDLTLEYSLIDTVLDLCQTNTVYLFDTVIRLAPTVGYQEYQLEEYNALRTYGMQARKELVGSELTTEKIIESYPLAPNGAPILTDISDSLLSQYHAARARKLKLIDYALKKVGDRAGFFYIGVDDSSPQNTIQTNEIAYINSLLGPNSALSVATDELALCCLARMISGLYDVEVPLQVTYFGSGEDAPADSFDTGTLKDSMQNHLKALSVKSAENGLHVLCVTRGCSDADRNALLGQIKDNQAKRIPTVLIDVSEDPEMLSEKLLKDTAIDLTQLLGYSSWNTAANSIGLALSQGVARFAYLSAVDQSSQSANEGFLQGMTFSYIKDISYKIFHPSLDGFLSDDHPCSPANVLKRINSGKIITSLKYFAVKAQGNVSVSNFRYPWNRTFEMCFDIYISAD